MSTTAAMFTNPVFTTTTNRVFTVTGRRSTCEGRTEGG